MGAVSEYYFVEAGEGGDFAGVAHEAFGGCVNGVEDGEFGDAGGAWRVVMSILMVLYCRGVEAVC